MLLMDSSISSKWNVSASQATFFEMLSAWSASFLADMTRISKGANHRACKEGRQCQYLRELSARLLLNDRISAGNRSAEDSAHESVGSDHVTGQQTGLWEI